MSSLIVKTSYSPARFYKKKNSYKKKEILLVYWESTEPKIITSTLPEPYGGLLFAFWI